MTRFLFNVELSQCLFEKKIIKYFLNSLVTDIKALDTGIDIDGEKVGILLYAGDIVLIVQNESDLQLLLDILKCMV